MLGRLSLRARLVIGVFVLAAVGLAVADVATYTSLRSFLLDRVDNSLEAGHVQAERLVSDDRGPQHGEGGGPGGGGRGGPPAQGIDWYQVRTLAGGLVSGGFLVGSGSPPKLPAQIDVPSGSKAVRAASASPTSRSRPRTGRRAIAFERRSIPGSRTRSC